MTSPEWLLPLLAYKHHQSPLVASIVGCNAVPNIADVSSKASVAIAHHAFQSLGVTKGLDGTVKGKTGSSVGTPLEELIRTVLTSGLAQSDPRRGWRVGTDDVKQFEQYQHLGELQRLLKEQPNLRTTLGTDYSIRPDVTVGVSDAAGTFLHAVVSCKWTLRSDRAQNVRHEFKPLIASRRGRAPHLVAVTVEPFPGRLLSLTRGTGEIDAVYHLAFHETTAAVNACGTPEQRDAWEEMTSQGRLRDVNSLIDDLTRM